jgi:lysophospholipase L1-like esterase
MRHLLATLGLGPVLVLQGLAVRRRTPVLPEPPGERSGVAGQGPPLRLLVIGDSAAAGVGAPHQEQALSGCLVRQLAPRRRVHWHLEAANGATTRSTLQTLGRREPLRCDVAMTSLGVNDVTSGIRRSTWRRQQAGLRTLLREAFGARMIIVSGLPPMHAFPALPQPLRWYLGQRATQLDGDLKEDLSQEPASVFLSLRFTQNVAGMAADGFHPGPSIYSEWARRAAGIILAVEPRPAQEPVNGPTAANRSDEDRSRT